tara:strand:+ start:2101 stop:2271 length:171 start_codon:yes stop_codon:yes gene_type:complete
MSNKLKLNIGLGIKNRNPERVLMDRHTTPKVFKSVKNELNDKEALKEIKDFLEGKS